MAAKQEKPLQVEMLAPASLIPYAKNARKHSSAQIAQIAASIREFGFNAPVLIDENNGIVAGHGRVEAATSLGLESVPCVRLSHLTNKQRRAYILADNRIALSATWDNDLLSEEIGALVDESFGGMGLLGWTDGELAAILNGVQVDGDLGIEWADPSKIDAANEDQRHFVRVEITSGTPTAFKQWLKDAEGALSTGGLVVKF
jgi:hypothetical protein